MTIEEKKQVTKISQQFAKGLGIPLAGSGWLIVDPLSAYLNVCGFENKLDQLPANDKHPQVLIMTFKDGSIFIPAGKDLQPVQPESKNWIWV